MVSYGVGPCHYSHLSRRLNGRGLWRLNTEDTTKVTAFSFLFSAPPTPFGKHPADLGRGILARRTHSCELCCMFRHLVPLFTRFEPEHSASWQTFYVEFSQSMLCDYALYTYIVWRCVIQGGHRGAVWCGLESFHRQRTLTSNTLY